MMRVPLRRYMHEVARKSVVHRFAGIGGPDYIFDGVPTRCLEQGVPLVASEALRKRCREFVEDRDIVEESVFVA